MQCIRSIKTANAAGTIANRRTHEKAYRRFCHEYQFDVIYPASDWRIVQFAQFLFNENKHPDTIENYVSSIRVLHKLAGMPCPDASQIHYVMIKNSFKRKNTEPVRQAAPMDHDILLTIFPQVDLNSELEAVAWTAVLVGFSLVLRISNLGPVSRNKFDEKQNLICADFAIKEGFPSLGIR